jgi:hypothetical protein
MQEAIRMTKVFDSCSGLARRPKQQFPGPSKFGVIFWHYFNARHAPLKLSEYSVGVFSGLVYLLDSCMKQSTCLKSLRISVGWPGPKQQVPVVQNGMELFAIGTV